LLIEFKVHGLFGRLEFIVCLPLRLFHSLLTNCFEFSDKLFPSLPSPNGQSVVFSEVLGYLKGNSTVMRKPLSHIGIEIRRGMFPTLSYVDQSINGQQRQGS